MHPQRVGFGEREGERGKEGNREGIREEKGIRRGMAVGKKKISGWGKKKE